MRALVFAGGSLLCARVALAKPADGSSGNAAGGAAAMVHFTAADPMAEAIGFHADARTVDVKEFADYRPGARCANCVQCKGTEGDVWRPCTLLPGKVVPAAGWCQLYAKKA